MLTNDQLVKIVSGKLRSEFRPNKELTVNSLEEGVKIWSHHDVIQLWEKVVMKWKPLNQTAVLIPCSAKKPYPYSKSHRDGYLPALLPYLSRLDLFAMSEPMGIVPYRYADEYPVNSYEYDPHKFFMGKLNDPKVQRALKLFHSRVADWVKKYHYMYDKKILVLPRSWHLKVFREGVKLSGCSINDYSIVTLPGRPQHHVNAISQSLSMLF